MTEEELKQLATKGDLQEVSRKLHSQIKNIAIHINGHKEVTVIHTKIEEVPTIGGYISEATLKKILGRSDSWFWRMRTAGKLSSTKLEGKRFYKVDEITTILDNNLVEAENQQ